MKKIYVFLLFINFSLFATEIHKFKLNDNQKLESTYSGTINQSTFHTAIVKNKDAGNYEIITHYVNELQQTVKLDITTFDFEPSIIAHHHSGDTLTIINQKNSILAVIKYNLKTNTSIVETVELGKLRNKLSQDDKTILITYPSFRKDFTITQISNKGIRTIPFNVDESEAKRYNENFFLEDPTVVNTLEFIENGPSTNSKCFYYDHYYIVLRDSRYTGMTTAMIVDIDSGSVVFKNYINKPFKQKSLTSFLSNGQIFSIAGTKDNLIFKSFDLFTGEEGVLFELNEDLNTFLPKNITSQEFVKRAKKFGMKPTIAVNKAGQNYAVRLDIVNLNEYNYYNSWQNDMMWQQHMMMEQGRKAVESAIRKSYPNGPNPTYYDHFINNYYPDGKKYAFTFFLDKDLNILPDTNIQTDYINPDKEKYLKPIFKNKALKEIAPTFTKQELRYICRNKEIDEIIIVSDKLENNSATELIEAK